MAVTRPRGVSRVQAIRTASAFDVGKLLFVGALWGLSFILMSLALESFGPVSIAAWRITLAALVLLIVCLATGRKLPGDPEDWRKMLVIGALNSALPFFLISWGLQFISSAESALLLATGTFCSLILSHFITTDERINRARAMGVFLGFCGVAMLVLDDLVDRGFGGIRGQLAVMGAGISYAVSSVMSRRISHLPSLPAATGILATGACYMLPLAFWLEQPFNAEANSTALLALLALGVFATGLAYVIRLNIIRYNGAVFMSQVGYLVPLFGVFWAWLLLSEAISLRTLLALGAICLGIVITRRGTR